MEKTGTVISFSPESSIGPERRGEDEPVENSNPQMAETGNSSNEKGETATMMISNNENHDDWRIALYYCYIDIPTKKVAEHVDFHRQLCESMDFRGRIRISHEGINGVLSGLHQRLLSYEELVTQKLQKEYGQASSINNENNSSNSNSNHNTIDLNFKYCLLRQDLPVEAQLFDSLIVKETKTVISLFDRNPNNIGTEGEDDPTFLDSAVSMASNDAENLASASNTSKTTTTTGKSTPRSKQSKRRQRRKKQRKEQKKHNSAPTIVDDTDVVNLQKQILNVQPSTHLSPTVWNEKLLLASSSTSCLENNGNDDNKNSQNHGALLLDVRNVYESRIGRFQVPNIPTLLTNTRKYSDLPQLLANHPSMASSKQIYMYCTGGVRCERVSQLVQTLYPDKQVYQLQGGIQTYLQQQQQKEQDQPQQNSSPNQCCLFEGKNFVFDPRRTDPSQSRKSIIGTCLVCHALHDDYDNGHAPSENKEARCNNCRMLILVCNACRPNYTCWGEQEQPQPQPQYNRPLLYCGLDKCIHEGANPEPEILLVNDETTILQNMEASTTTTTSTAAAAGAPPLSSQEHNGADPEEQLVSHTTDQTCISSSKAGAETNTEPSPSSSAFEHGLNSEAELMLDGNDTTPVATSEIAADAIPVLSASGGTFADREPETLLDCNDATATLPTLLASGKTGEQANREELLDTHDRVPERVSSSMPTDSIPMSSSSGNNGAANEAEVSFECDYSKSDTSTASATPSWLSSAELESDPEEDAVERKSAPTSSTKVTGASSSSSGANGMNAASSLYQGAKSVWSWGMNIPILSIGLGVAQAVAGTVLVSVAGGNNNNLQDIENHIIRPQLANLDDNLLNPVLQNIAKLVLGATGKTQDFVKPIIASILFPLGLIKDERPTTAEDTAQS